jgi:hypothetical protein
MSNPAGVAVAGAGDVYVADQSNQRIDEYSPSGSFVRAFGKDVGGAGVDVCTTSCNSGSAGGGAGQLINPFGVAVAGSGDVYVADNSNTRIDEFGPARATPTLSTSASSAQVGSAISDTATLTGGNSPTGTITFKAYDNSSCSGTPAFEADNITVASASASSGDFTPTAAGSYYWTASYSGDAGNDPVSSVCGVDPNETSTVSPIETPPVSAAKPSNMSRPSIGSAGKAGDDTTCNPGTWTGSPSSFAYSWTIDSSIIAGQHASTYELAAGDAGHEIRCEVVAHNSAGDSASATSNALSVAKPKSACKDTIRPMGKIASSKLKKGKLALSGTASDKPCNGKPGHVVRVVVTISRHIGNGCRFLRESGHSFGPLRRCDGEPPIVFPAKGTSKWSLMRPAVLPAGRYTIRSRATDAAGNVEAVRRRGANVLSLRVK